MNTTTSENLLKPDINIAKVGIEILYFSTNSCNVCKVLKPKVIEIANKYKDINFVYVDTENNPEIAANYSVFAVPTIILTIDGREYQRFNRNISMETFSESIDRYFNLYTNS